MKLAINGGKPVRTQPFPNQANIGPEEFQAVQRVLETQMLSGYRGNAQKYRGGKEVQALEEQWSKKFGNKHSIAINSCTSALHVACGAIGLKPGDEVIVTPYSMTCSATAPMLWGAIPVFADVEPKHFCLDPKSVEEKITERTKAIIAVDLFGQLCSGEIRRIADKHKLWVIEDAAQAVGAKFVDEGKNEMYSGNFGHIGCFSFTQGKHMTSGEGGMITTNNDILTERCRLLMNHAEAVINDRVGKGKSAGCGFKESNKNLFGFNMRMTEIQAAIIQEQLKKLDFFIGKRQENAEYLIDGLKEFPLAIPCRPRENCTHTYYCQPFLYDQNLAEGIHRDVFIKAVKAELTPMRGREDEGVRIGCGYIKPIYRMPVFNNRFIENEMTSIDRLQIYPLPNVERLWKDELFLHLYLAPPTNRKDLNDILDAFSKVWKYREELK